MSWGAKRSIALRLTLFYALFFGIVTAGGGFLLYHLVKIHLVEELDQDLLRQAQEITSILATHDNHALQAELASSTANGGREDYFVRILDAQSKVELASDLRAWQVPLPSVPATGLAVGQLAYLTVDIPDARRQARVLTSTVAPARVSCATSLAVSKPSSKSLGCLGKDRSSDGSPSPLMSPATSPWVAK